MKSGNSENREIQEMLYNTEYREDYKLSLQSEIVNVLFCHHRERQIFLPHEFEFVRQKRREISRQNSRRDKKSSLSRQNSRRDLSLALGKILSRRARGRGRGRGLSVTIFRAVLSHSEIVTFSVNFEIPARISERCMQE